MRLIVARCAVDYTGRLTAHLPEALRLIVVKADGSVLVHADAGGYKPLNWNVRTVLRCPRERTLAPARPVCAGQSAREA